MKKERLNEERIQKRVKERYLWSRVGWVAFVLGFGLAILSVLSSIFLDMPFNLFDKLIDISLFGIFLGVICLLLLSRLGWSKSKQIDFLLNRLSISLMIIGVMIGTVFSDIVPNSASYGPCLGFVGAILALFGMRFQSSIEGDN